jgi:hypothetical protein
VHILLALLGIISTIGVVLYRLHLAKDVADGLVDTAERAGGAWRRHKFRKRAEQPPLETVDDPRIGAAAVMVALAEAQAPMNAEMEQRLCDEIESVLGVADSDEMLAYARHLTRDLVDPSMVVMRTSKLFNATLGDAEKADLLGMLKRISRGDAAQITAIELLRSRLGM